MSLSSVPADVDVRKVMDAAIGDQPQVFYFDKSQVHWSVRGHRKTKVFLTGLFPPNQIASMNAELNRAVSAAIHEIEERCPFTTYEKLLYIYEYLQDHVTYDENEFSVCNQTGKSGNLMSHYAYGVLIHHTGVCDGISSAYALIAQAMGLDCTVISGKSTVRTDTGLDHAWNIVEIGGRFYHLDATWDVCHKVSIGDYCYEYFCLWDAAILRDHTWDRQLVPPCTQEEYSYYKRSGGLIKSIPQMERAFANIARSKQMTVRIKIMDDLSIPKPEGQFLAQKLVDISAANGMAKGISYTWNDRTRCFYAKFTS